MVGVPRILNILQRSLAADIKERKALAGIALTTDTSALSAIGNDYGFEFVFQGK